MPDMVLGDLRVEPGKKSYGSLKIGETPTCAIELPIGIINGKNPGPVLCLTAGSHACEYPGIDAAIRIFSETDPSRLRGGVITVPVVNVTGFERATVYVCPIDNGNIAFSFPGRPDGSLSQVTAYFLLEKVVPKAGYYIDLHGGDVPELLMPYTSFIRTGVEKVDRESIAMAELYGTEYIEDRTSGGSAEAWPSTNMLFGQACKRGIPGIVAESGVGLGTYEESDIAFHVEGVRNVMRYLKMIEGTPSKPHDKQKMWRDMTVINVRRGGLFYPKVKHADVVSKGQNLGSVKNLRGEVVEEIASTKDGIVMIMYPRHVVNTGDVVFNIATDIEEHVRVT